MDQPGLYVLQLSEVPRKGRFGRTVAGFIAPVIGAAVAALLSAAAALCGLWWLG